MVLTTQRMLALLSGKRISMKLDDATWQAIDWLAEQCGKSWQDWCSRTLANMDEGENMTAALREAAMSGLMEETIFADRAGQLEAMELHPLMRNSAALNDQQLEEILSKARMAPCKTPGSKLNGRKALMTKYLYQTIQFKPPMSQPATACLKIPL